MEIKPLPKINDNYSHWTVIAGPIRKKNGSLWLCRCICGKEKEVQQYQLTSGLSNSCGCQRNKGNVTSPETKELLKHRRSAQTAPRPRGSITSEETKIKLSESAKARWAIRKAIPTSIPTGDQK